MNFTSRDAEPKHHPIFGMRWSTAFSAQNLSPELQYLIKVQYYDSIDKVCREVCDNSCKWIQLKTIFWMQGRIEHNIWGWWLESGLVWSWILFLSQHFSIFCGWILPWSDFCWSKSGFDKTIQYAPVWVYITLISRWWHHRKSQPKHKPVSKYHHCTPHHLNTKME